MAGKLQRAWRKARRQHPVLGGITMVILALIIGFIILMLPIPVFFMLCGVIGIIVVACFTYSVVKNYKEL